MYYRIHGTTSDYAFESDKRIVKKQFDRSEDRKRSIQEALKKEFGDIIIDVQEPSNWKDDNEPVDPKKTREADEEFLDFEVGGESKREDKEEFMWDDGR